MTALKLYYSPGACSLAPHIALEEVGIAYEPVKVALAKGEQRTPEYLAINPKGRVPVLAEDDWVLTENAAILPYIAQRFPEARLWPSDKREAARAAEWIGWIASTVHIAYAHVRRPERYAADPKAIEDVIAKGKESCRDIWGQVDKKLELRAVGGREGLLGRRSVSSRVLDLGPRPDARLRHGERLPELDRACPAHGRAGGGEACLRARVARAACLERNPLGLNRARLRARRRAFPSPLRGGVGVGGGGSNSDVRACARRLQCLVCRHRALRLRPPPRSAFQAESALPARGRERVAALRRCFSPSGSCFSVLAAKACFRA